MGSVVLQYYLYEHDRNVVIENQLTTSDHEHLRKAITYATGVDADIIVWIALRSKLKKRKRRSSPEWPGSGKLYANYQRERLFRNPRESSIHGFSRLITQSTQ